MSSTQTFFPSNAPRGMVYALVDCNNFYVSCERVFAPRLQGRPVVVLSNNDGCIIARSEEAKTLGIAMGEPFHKREPFLRREGVNVFSSNYPLYGDMSARVMEALSRFTPHQEIYSIDECFLGFVPAPDADLLCTARHIRETVRQWTGIPVSVGLAPTKTLAKIANRCAKKDPASKNVCLLGDTTTIKQTLARTDVEDIWGIGRRYARFLHTRGVDTGLDLVRMPRDWVRNHLTVVGLQTVLELDRQPCFVLETTPAPAKSIVCSRSFGRRIRDKQALGEALARHIQRAAERLRAKGLLAHTVRVALETNRFQPGPQYAARRCQTLFHPTDATPALHKAAQGLLDVLYRSGFAYQKIGVTLLELVPHNHRQASLFPPAAAETGRQRDLMRTVDHLNTVYGRDTVTWAASGLGPQQWHMRQNHVSPRYTTAWDELPCVG